MIPTLCLTHVTTHSVKIAKEDAGTYHHTSCSSIFLLLLACGCELCPSVQTKLFAYAFCPKRFAHAVCRCQNWFRIRICIGTALNSSVYSSFVYVISKKAASSGRRFGKKFSSKETVEYNVAQKEYDFSISRRSTIKKSLKMARFEFLAIALIMAIAIQEGKYRHFKIIRTILRGLTLNCGELNESVSYSFEESF